MNLNAEEGEEKEILSYVMYIHVSLHRIYDRSKLLLILKRDTSARRHRHLLSVLVVFSPFAQHGFPLLISRG